MEDKSHRRSEKVYFYHLGIADKDYFDEKRQWPMKTLGTMIKDNGHEHVRYSMRYIHCETFFRQN